MAQAAEEQHRHNILDQFTRQAEPFAQAMARSPRESLSLLLDGAGVTASDTALDVACGPGIVTCALASVARHAIGIDLVPAMIEQARKRQMEMGLENIDWRLGDVARLPFRDAVFSLVVTRYSFHHFLEPRRVLEEMARVCRPGGRVGVADATPEAGKATAYDELETLRDPSHTRALPLEQLQALATGLPLTLVRHNRLSPARRPRGCPRHVVSAAGKCRSNPPDGSRGCRNKPVFNRRLCPGWRTSL